MNDDPGSEALDESSPSNRRRVAVRLVLSLLLGGLFVWILTHGGLPVWPPRAQLAAVPWWGPVGYLATTFGMLTFRATRYRHLLRPIAEVPLRVVVGVCWIAFAAVLFFPLRSGEVVRPLLIRRHAPVRGWQAAGTVGAERVIDGLVLMLILFAGLSLSTPLDPLPDRIGAMEVPVSTVPRAAYFMLGVFAAGFVVLALFAWRGELARKLVEDSVGRFAPELGERLAGVAESITDGLKFLPSARLGVPFLIETVLYWGCAGAGFALLAQACGLSHIGLAEGCVMIGVLGIGILVPSAPGYFGSYQIAIYAALAMFVPVAGVTREGTLVVFISYCIQIGLTSLAAAVGALLLRGTVLLRGTKLAQPDEAS